MSEVYMNSATQLGVEILRNLVEEHYKNRVEGYLYLYDLYKGKHDILSRVNKDPNKPNNKLVNDFYGQIIDDTIGYFLGKPIILSVEDEGVAEQLERILEDNNVDDLFMEIGKEMSIKGMSALLVYQNEDSETKMVRLPAEEVILVYDSSKTNELQYAIRVYELDVVSADGKTVDKTRYAEVYSAQDIAYYIESKAGWLLDVDRENPVAHIYGRVPVVPFFNNEEQLSDLARVESLVNDYDKILSDASNEQEAYRNAYLVLKNMIMNSETMAKLKENGVIEVDDEGDAKFLVKDIPIAAIKEHLDRLEKNIHKFSHVPDMSDESFAGNLSGVAIQFKLIGLENKCVIKERKMTKAIKDMIRILSIPLKVLTGKLITPADLTVSFTRNVPNNLVEIAEVVSKLNGVVDKETLLSLLPFVDNPQEVLDRMEKEKKELAAEMKESMQTGDFAANGAGQFGQEGNPPQQGQMMEKGNSSFGR